MPLKFDAVIDGKKLQDSIARGVREYNRKFASKETLKLKIDEKGFRQPLGRITGDINMFDSALAASNARVIAFGASTAVIGGLSKAFKDLAQTTIEVRKAFVDINRILQINSKNFEAFGNQLFDIGKKNASAFKDTTKAALEFARQGLSTVETLKRTNDALTLVRLTGINADKAVASLTATVNAFDNAMVTTTTSVHKFVAVETKFAVGARDLVEAVGRVGSSALDAKVGFDELNAVVTSVQQTTGRGGAVIGNAMKTIFTRLQRQSTLEALESYNVAVKDIQGNTLPAIQILHNFAGAYKGLTNANQAYLREQVAGVFQANILSAIVRDLSKQQSTYSSALKVSAGATNEADSATAQLNSTLAALASQTALEFKRLQENIGKQTFEPIAKAILDPLKMALEGINTLIDGEGVGSEVANGLLKGIKNVIGGPGLVMIGGILLKVFTNTVGYIAKALPQLMGMTLESTKRAAIEEFINTVMASEADLAKAIAANEGNAAVQAELLLGFATQAAVQFDLQEQSVMNIASTLARIPGGYTAVKGATGGGKATPRGASGFVPGMQQEAHDIKNGVGGVKPSARPVGIPNFSYGGGKRGPMIANTGEYMVPNFRGEGEAGRAAMFKAAKGMGVDLDPKMRRPDGKGWNYSKQNIIQELTRKKGLAKKRTTQTHLDARGFAAMLVPQENYRGVTPYTFTKPATQTMAAKVYGKGKKINSVAFDAFGLSSAADEDVKKGGNLGKVDQILDDSLVAAANAVFASYSPAIAKPAANKERLKAEYLQEGGQGAMDAFKGSLFEALVNRIIGQNIDKKGNTLDVFLDKGGASGIKAKELFGIKRKVSFGDVKSSESSGNRTKFVNQILANAKKSNRILPPMAASGYVPNFAALGESVEREVAAGVPLGAIRVNQSKGLRSPNNPAGLGVTNTRDEPRGLKDVMGGARGYIPNYAATPAEAVLFDLKGLLRKTAPQFSKLEKVLNGFIQELLEGKINQDQFNAKVQKAGVSVGKFDESTKGGARKIAMLGNRAKKASTAVAGRVSGGSAVSGMRGMAAGMGLSMGLPMLAGGIEQAMGEGSKGGQVTGGALTGAGTGASMGMMFGPWGAGIGAAVGALGGLANAAMDAGKSFEQLQREAKEYDKTTADAVTGAQEYIQAQKDLTTAITDSELEDAQKRLAKNFDAIKGTALEEQFLAAGTNVDSMVSALQGFTKERTMGSTLKTAAAAAKRVDDTDWGKMVGMDAGGTKRYFDAIKKTRQVDLGPDFGGATTETYYDYKIGKEGLEKLRQDYGKFFDVIASATPDQKSEFAKALKDQTNQMWGFGENMIADMVIDMNVGFKAQDHTTLAQLFQDLEDGTEGRLYQNFEEVLNMVTRTGDEGKAAAKRINRKAAEALESFTDIRNAMTRISESLLRVSSFAGSLGKLRKGFGGSMGGILTEAGAQLGGIGFRREQEARGMGEKKDVFAFKFAADNVTKIIDKIKSGGAAVGDPALQKLRETSMLFTGGETPEERMANIKTALDQFKEFTTSNKTANQVIQSQISKLKTEYELQKRNFQIEEAVNKAKFDLEEQKAKNLLKEKALQAEQAKVMHERQKSFILQRIETEKQKALMESSLKDPRAFRGMRTTRGITERQGMERSLSDMDFAFRRKELTQQNVQKVAQAQVARQQLDSRMTLINSQSILNTTIQELIAEMRKEKNVAQAEREREEVIGGQKKEVKILQEETLKKIARKKEIEEKLKGVENPSLSAGPAVGLMVAHVDVDKEIKDLDQKRKEKEADIQKTEVVFDKRIAAIRAKSTKVRPTPPLPIGMDPASAGLREKDPSRFYSLQQKSMAQIAKRLTLLKDEESIMEVLDDLRKSGTGAKQDENAVHNEIIDKVKRQVELGYFNLDALKKVADTTREINDLQERDLDAEAKSFKTQMGVGFDDIFKDIDYIYGRLGKDLPAAFRDGMVNALEVSLDKAESFGDAMRSFAVDFLKIIRRASLEASMSNLTSLLGLGTSKQFREGIVHERKGGIIGAQNGMYVSGGRTGDKNPAMLEDGEYVLNRKAVEGMGGKGNVDKINFGMWPRQGGGTMSLNESVTSPRMSGFFLSSDNPELQEARDKSREAWEKREAKRREKEAMKNQFLSTLMSTAVSGITAGITGRMKDRAGMKEAVKANPKLQESGNFFSGYGTTGDDADLAGFRAQTHYTPAQAQRLKLDVSKGPAKIPSSVMKVVNSSIDDRMAEAMGGKDVFKTFYRGNRNQARKDFMQQAGVDIIGDSLGTGMGNVSPHSHPPGGRRGGYINRGFSNRDSVPAFLSGGEYVMNNSAVKKYGLGFMGRLNGGVVPGFQEGGLVGGGPSAMPLNAQTGATTNNISINVSVGSGGQQQQGSTNTGGNANADQESNQDDATKGKDLSEKIRAKVLEVISEEQRLGGSLSKTARK